MMTLRQFYVWIRPRLIPRPLPFYSYIYFHKMLKWKNFLLICHFHAVDAIAQTKKKMSGLGMRQERSGNETREEWEGDEWTGNETSHLT